MRRKPKKVTAVKRIAQKNREQKQLAKVRKEFGRWLVREGYLTNQWP